MIGLITIGTIFNYLTRNILGVVVTLPVFKAELGITELEYGWVTAFFQGGYDTGMLRQAEAYFEALFSRRQSQQTGYRQAMFDYTRGSPLIPADLAARAGNFQAAPVARVSVVPQVMGASFCSANSQARVPLVMRTATVLGACLLRCRRMRTAVHCGRMRVSVPSPRWFGVSTVTMVVSPSMVRAPVADQPRRTDLNPSRKAGGGTGSTKVSPFHSASSDLPW